MVISGTAQRRGVRTGLVIDDLTAAHDGVDVVRGAGLELRPGQVTALVGPNGSGKSTTLRAAARLHRPRTGSVVLVTDADPRAGEGVTTTDALALSSREFARRVALLTQARATPGGLTVREVVELGRHPHRGRWGRPDPAGRAAVQRALALTGTTELADRGVDQLSGGQRQRAWLASCLAQDTGVLLLDEPTTHLDLRHQVELLDLVRDLADDQQVAVGVVLHDLDQAAAVADRLVLLAAGRVVASGTPEQVLTSALLTQAYGVRVDVHVDPGTGHLRTRARGRHSTRRPTPASDPADPTGRTTPLP